MPIVDTPARVDFTAWIGEQNTIFDLGVAASGLEFIGTADGNCDYSRYQACDAVRHHWVLGSSVRDSALALGGYAHYVLKNGAEISSEVTVRSEDLLRRRGAESFTFNQKLWIIGGYAEGWRNDIWSSVDGSNWKMAAEQGAFPAREYHRVSYFNNQLWLIGGDGSKGPTNDIWSSSDGVNWTLRNATPAFSPRYGHALFAFAGKLWLIGGEDDDGWYGDIWSSSDGVNWSQETESAAFGKRTSTQVVAFDGQLFLVGGYGERVRTNDIWTSVDGSNWTLANEHANFSPRYGHSIHQFDGKLWLTGGSTENLSVDEIWSSSDAIVWEQSSTKLPDTYFEHRVLALDDQLYLTGGFLRNAILGSKDSLTWNNMSSRTLVANACQYYEFQGQLYAASRDQLWRATTTKDWILLPQASPFPAQGICNPVAHGDKLYILGGFAGPADFRNDVWSSTDGETWERLVPAAPFSARANQSIASFNGKLWMIGGNDLYTSLDEIWTSVDGMEWEQVDSLDLPTSGVINKQLTVFDNKLWFIASYGSIWTTEKTLVAYSTADGVIWQPEEMNDLVIVDGFSILVHDQRLWLFNKNGTSGTIFSSSDGNNWAIEYDNLPFSMSYFFIWHDQLAVAGRTRRANGISSSAPDDLWMRDSNLEWRRAYKGIFIFKASD